MSAYLSNRPAAREAGPELLVLQRWEEFCAWLIPHKGRWPKSSRFVFGQRVQNHALDIVELLVVARWEPKRRRRSLDQANLMLERLRQLLRLARGAGIMSPSGFESAMRGLDESGLGSHCGRIGVGGWGLVGINTEGGEEGTQRAQSRRCRAED